MKPYWACFDLKSTGLYFVREFVEICESFCCLFACQGRSAESIKNKDRFYDLLPIIFQKKIFQVPQDSFMFLSDDILKIKIHKVSQDNGFFP